MHQKIDLFEYYIKKERETLNMTKQSGFDQKGVKSSLTNINNFLAIHSLLENQSIINSKERCSTIGQLAEYLNTYLASATWLGYRFSNFTYALCSDHLQLIERLGKLPIHPSIASVAQSENCIMFAMMALIRKDEEAVEQYIRTLEGIMRNSKASKYVPIYMDTLKGFVNKDPVALKRAILKFEDKRLKAGRIRANVDEKYISIMALGFTKLAWLQGMEIKVESEYIPKAWLPHNPLKDYTIPYWFLRDYYRELGVGWTYQPVYPEIQGNW